MNHSTSPFIMSLLLNKFNEIIIRFIFITNIKLIHTSIPLYSKMTVAQLLYFYQAPINPMGVHIFLNLLS